MSVKSSADSAAYNKVAADCDAAAQLAVCLTRVVQSYGSKPARWTYPKAIHNEIVRE